MENMKVTELRSLAKQLGMRGYYRLKKVDLIGFIINNLSLSVLPRQTSKPTLIINL